VAQLRDWLNLGRNTIDSLKISDAALLGSLCDGALLVVRLGSTPRHLVEQTYNMLETMGGNVLGTCLTGGPVTDETRDYAER